MYLVPPMADEPPPEFVAFVAAHLPELHRQTDQLVGSDPEGSHVYLDVLADVAGHWRRLRWWGQLTGRDTPIAYAQKRLADRTKEWRDDQIYDVDIRVLRDYPPVPVPVRSATASVALRKAKVIDGTVRREVRPWADAGIAWVTAYRRQEWHRAGRLLVGGVLLIGGMIQCMSMISPGS